MVKAGCAFTHSLAHSGIVAWEGIGDADGKPYALWLMKRGQGDERFYSIQNLRCDLRGARKILTSVDHPVSHGNEAAANSLA
jgi:hypothetical protein